MFGKPKKKIKLATPETAEEILKVAKGMAKMYPQMSDPNWGKPKRKEEVAPVKRVKQARKEQKSALEDALTPEEIKKLKVE